MPDNVNDLLTSIMGQLKNLAATDTIIGDRLTIGKKEVIPVSRIMVGFAVGGGEGQKSERGGFGDAGGGGGFGGAGGGGVRIDPVGFIVIDGEKVSFLPTKPGRLEGLIDAIPDVWNKVQDIRKDNASRNARPKKQTKK